MKKEVQSWIVNWFKRRNPGLAINVEMDFYQDGLVDSFGIIELIEEMESHFSIRFDDTDFKLPSFRIIQGLVQIIDQKMSNAP